MKKIRELWEQAQDYRRILIVMVVIGAIFVVAKHTLFNETKSSAEKIRYLILGGIMETLCVAPESNITLTPNDGLVATITGTRFDINGLWKPRFDEKSKDRYVAVIVRGGLVQEVLPIKKGLYEGYARHNREACLEYESRSYKPVNIIVRN